MSTTHRILVCLLFTLSISFSAEAQIFDKISRTINSAIDDTVDKFSDKMAEAMLEKFIEKVFKGEQANSDSLEQYQPDTTSSSNNSVDLSGLFGSKKKVDKKFSFDHKMVMNVSSEENVNELNYYLPTQGNYIGMEMNNIFIITEYETGESYTIMNGSLTSFNMTKIIEKYSAQAVDDNAEYNFKKTGRSEVIAGYKSEEYIGTSDGASIEMWISEKFVNQDIQYSPVITKLREQNENSQFPTSGHAMRIISKDNDTTTKIEVVSVTPEQKVVDLSEY